jgi:hypothetical protein
MPPPMTATLGGALLSTGPPWQTAPVEASRAVGTARSYEPMPVAY